MERRGAWGRIYRGLRVCMYVLCSMYRNVKSCPFCCHLRIVHQTLFREFFQ